MIVESSRYSAGQTIYNERQRELSKVDASRFLRRMCRMCKEPKSAEGGTFRNHVFVCKTCNEKRGVT